MSCRSASAGLPTAGLTLDAVSLLCRRLNKLVSHRRSMLVSDVTRGTLTKGGQTDIKEITDPTWQVITGDSGAMQRF